ncbi:MAG: small basic family protein [Clostridia bacterium]|nr:small basic family protein [Clostridia bacterium]MBQ4542592.1 small basic family protein [Clostridia bacterium]MBQ7075534.1 small basic family protein [Clostridia bacterium]MBQ9997613.1 small basic family protein [Clostridia bacterium]
MIIIVCLLLGTVIALLLPFTFSSIVSKFVSVAILAALDSVFGGLAASANNSFKMKIFITGFFGNALVAFLLTYMGSLLNIDLTIAAIVVFGTRIFQNFAILRRFVLERYMSKKETKNL